MTDRFDLQTAIQHIEGAFSPFECVVETFDWDKKVRFRVYDENDKPLITMSEALANRVRDPSGLLYIVNEVRQRLERKGCQLGNQ